MSFRGPYKKYFREADPYGSMPKATHYERRKRNLKEDENHGKEKTAAIML